MECACDSGVKQLWEDQKSVLFEMNGYMLLYFFFDFPVELRKAFQKVLRYLECLCPLLGHSFQGWMCVPDPLGVVLPATVLTG